MTSLSTTLFLQHVLDVVTDSMQPYTVTEILKLKETPLTFTQRIDIKNRKRPTPIFTFAGDRQSRLHEQYANHDWLCGSDEKRGLFCFPCLVFKDEHSRWTSTGITDIGNLTNLKNSHVKTQSHKSACLKLTLLGQVNIASSIDRSIVIEHAKYNAQVRNNRVALKHHFAVVLYLVKHGLALRGHDESKESHNRGNYRDLLELCAEFSGNTLVHDMLNNSNSCDSQQNDDGGDNVLSNNNGTAVQFSGTSPDIQNDIIMCFHTHLISGIREKIQNARRISIMSDECTDLSTKSQMAVSVRLASRGEVSEHLIDIQDVSDDRTADVLANKMTESLASCVGVGPGFSVVGQSYDGAPNMAGCRNSVQARLLEVWPEAHFTHCYAHKLALVMKKACEDIHESSSFFGFIHNLCAFFKSSPKRASLLVPSLPRENATRWLSRGKSVQTVNKHYDTIKKVLLSIKPSTGFDAMTVAESNGLTYQLTQLGNVFFLKAFDNILGAANLLTFALQKTNIDPASVCSKLKDFKTHTQAIKTEAEFNSLWDETMKLEPDIPRQRRANRQPFLDSGFTPSAEDEMPLKTKFKSILVDAIDTIHNELDNRFNDFEKYQWVQLIHPSSFNVYRSTKVLQRDAINNFMDLYPSVPIDRETLLQELSLLYFDSDVRSLLDSKGVTTVADLCKVMFDLDLVNPLPNDAILVEMALSIAITSVSCERSFSVLRRVKNYTRTTMTQQRTKHVMLLAVESKMLDALSKKPRFFDDCIDIFAHMKERKITLIYKA